MAFKYLLVHKVHSAFMGDIQITMYMQEGGRSACWLHGLQYMYADLKHVSNDIHVCPRTPGGLIVCLIAVLEAREFT